MQPDDMHLCSDLIRIFVGRAAAIANLEQISADRCTITMDTPIPAGATVRMECVECSLDKPNCTECRFKGKIESHREDPPLGHTIEIVFEGRKWSEQGWRPRHLTNTKLLLDTARRPGCDSESPRQPVRNRHTFRTSQS